MGEPTQQPSTPLTDAQKAAIADAVAAHGDAVAAAVADAVAAHDAELLTKVEAMIAAATAEVIHYGEKIALRAEQGSLLCAEEGGPTEEKEPFLLTARKSVNIWESFTTERGR